ncbi:hypothetical protein KQH82_03980 [bacterium]|nr:hypothetical protein [bacterium]
MDSAKSGRRKQFEKDAFPHFEALWKSALWLTMRSSSAEELLAESLTKAYLTWHDCDSELDSKARLFRVMAREFAPVGTRQRLAVEFLPEFGTAENNDDNSEFLSVSAARLRSLQDVTIPNMRIKGAIARLRPMSRLVIILLVREEFSYAEIAYITDLRRASVKAIVGRLHRYLPRYLARYADAPAEGIYHSNLKSVSSWS